MRFRLIVCLGLVLSPHFCLAEQEALVADNAASDRRGVCYDDVETGWETTCCWGGTCTHYMKDNSLLKAEHMQTNCANACDALAGEVKDSTLYGLPSSLERFRESYHCSYQQEITPACVISPKTEGDVSKSLRIVQQHNCHFAVKSGGHSMFEGASNALGGVTFDLRNFNTIEISSDLQTARVGTGNRWMEVYMELEQLSRTVVGGRMGAVGVGGFILGGGISFISRRHGWALDNVRNFEVILANGTITNANQSQNSDLYWALRGGGNNFGIVTHFDLETHPQEQVFGGENFYITTPSDMSAREVALNILPMPFTISLVYFKNKICDALISIVCKLGYCITSDDFLRVIVDATINGQEDPYAQYMAAFTWSYHVNAYISNLVPLYSKPVKNPEVFKDMLALPSIYSSNSIKKMTEMIREVDALNKSGLRQYWAAITIKPSIELLSKIVDIYTEEIQEIRGVKDIIPSLVYQPINRDEIKHFSKNGGNCLGLEDSDGPFIIFSIVISWSEPRDDKLVETAGNNMVARSTVLAKDMALHHRYIYQNYAHSNQDVFGGYGEENRKRLLEIQKKYDPQGVFAHLQPGYFKLDGSTWRKRRQTRDELDREHEIKNATELNQGRSGHSEL